MIIASDFDGVLCKHEFPKIGEENPVVLSMLKSLRAQGNKVILWTCRNGVYLDQAIAWCALRGLYFDAVNCDTKEIQESDFGKEKSCKIFADVYFDDRNMVINHMGLLLGQKG